MSTTHRILRSKTGLRFISTLATLAFLGVAPSMRAQNAELAPSTATAASSSAAPETTPETKAELELPDAPGAALSSSSNASEVPGGSQFSRRLTAEAELAKRPASTTDKFIFPGQVAPPLTAGDKIQLGIIHGVSPYSIAGWFVSAGYSHVVNTTPQYGTDKGAFGERLGAAALRGYTQELFTDSVMAPLLHQDPRYYKLGRSHTIVRRAAYAASRPLITRNDDGRLAPNYSQVSGNLLSSALTNAYYPQIDRGFGQTAITFRNAMIGAAVGDLAAEFLSGALEAIHLKGVRN